MTEPDIRQRTDRSLYRRFRHLQGFISDPLQSMVDASNQGGDLFFHELVGNVRLVQLSHPELIEQVLKGKSVDVGRDWVMRSIRDALGLGLLTSEGEQWTRHRKMAAPHFQPRSIAAYGEDMVRLAHRYADRITPGDRFINEDMMALTLDVVLRTLFGPDLEVDKQVVADSLDIYQYEFFKDTNSWRRLIPKHWMTPGRYRRKDVVKNLDDVMYSVIAQRRAMGLGDDMLSNLIAATDDAGSGMDDKQLRDEAVTIFVAGHETTALNLTYTLWLLAAHPEVVLKVRAELDEVCGNSDPTAAQTRKALPYTTAVVNESMRLLPPAYIVGRELTADAEIGGMHFPNKTHFICPQWVVQRDPRWFVDPMSFRPERWLNGETDNLPKFAFFPFGGGARVCVGQHFAMMESILILAVLVRRLEVARVPNYRLRFIPALTLRPKEPVPLTVSAGSLGRRYG